MIRRVSGNNSSPEIALFLPTLTPGGIERCILNLADGFIQHGVTVDLVVADYRGEFISKIPEKATVVDLEVDRVLKSILPLRSYLQDHEPSVLLSGHTHANVAAIIANKISGASTRSAIGIHNTLFDNDSTGQGLTSRSVRAVFPRLYTYADHIIAVSHGTKRDLLDNTDISSGQVSVIHNPVVSDELYVEADKEVNHRWLTDESVDLVLAAGRLAEQKDFETLLRAFAEVIKENEQARLLLVGTGPKERKLREVISTLDIEDRVEMVGYVENLYAHMKQADAFVLSSRWEGFGIVLVEAMAVGTPVVSTDCPHGPSEILRNGEFGELVPVGAHEQLGTAILHVLSENPDLRQLKRRASDFSVSKISDECIVELSGLDK